MKFFQILIFIFLFGKSLFGQVILQGSITSVDGPALSRINILVYLPDSKALIAFAISDENGHFQTKVNSPSDSLLLEISSIQYRNEFRSISNTSQTLEFELITEVKKLEGITVRAKAIEQRGDTISYLVSSFAKMEDRAIEDVLRRMPGIEVEPSGRILYQGLPLEKFYVEGLDLMDGRYGVVSKNLPQESVSTVEILENHQPIRILEDRVTSQQASLNLKLKRSITTTGTANLGAGAAPFLWDVNVTPMTFTKNFQVVSSYQANNSGNDVSRQLKTLTIRDILRNVNRPVENPALLNIQNVNPPEIDESRYHDNNVHLINLNGLQRINNDFQLRANLYYVNDYQQQLASLRRTYFMPTDTLSFSEQFNNKTFVNHLHGKFTLSRNVKKNFLNNELKVQSRWDKQTGMVCTDYNEINQSLKNPMLSISNDLRSINPVGKHLVEFNSYISYDNNPHRLDVKPGQFDEVLNQGEPYDRVTQQIDLKRFYADHSAGFVFGLKRVSFTPRIGIAYRRQWMESNIIILHHDVVQEAGTGFTNEMDNRHMRAYFNTEIAYKKSRFTLKARLPLSWNYVYLDDLSSEQGQELSRMQFNPSLSADYKVSGFWRTSIMWSLTNRLGDIDGVYYGFILRNYRNLSQNTAPISETAGHNFSLKFSYRNPITSFFNTFGYIYSIGHKNLTFSNIVQSDGTTVLQAIDLPQTTFSHNLQGYSSKYFASIGTTISIRANFNQHQGISLMNGELFNTKNLFYNFKPELNIRLTSWLNSDYGLNASFIETFIENERKSKISMLRHNLNFYAFPTKNQLISLSSQYYHHRGSNNFFLDLLYRYTIIKKKVDVEARWNNILNNKTYTTYQASAFAVYESTYVLRPSQVILSVKFSF
nr:hypothetical protein [Bacteroidota bacterium]